MNAIAGTLVMLWVTGWTLAAVRAGLKARVGKAGGGPATKGWRPDSSIND